MDFSQIIIAARNRDVYDGGWMQILILVALAAVYAVGSILKSKASKLEQEREAESAGKPARKPSEAGKSLQKQLLRQAPARPAGPVRRRQYRPQVRPQPRKIVRPEPVAQDLTAKTEDAFQLPTLEVPEVPKLTPPAPQLQPKLEELPELTRYASELSLDYADPDRLRRAILHYEILGKPLSLRDPSQHIIGL